MANLRIEYVPVKIGYLGLLGFDHIQLTLELDPPLPGDPLNQDTWLVIEGTKNKSDENGLSILGGQGVDGITQLRTLYDLSGRNLVDLIGTPQERGSRVILSGGEAVVAWYNISEYGAGIDALRLPYSPYSFPYDSTPTINSTSFAASVLHAAGIDIQKVWPSGVTFSPGYTTLIGTPGDDQLSTKDTGFTTLVGGSGNDKFYGTSAEVPSERFYGGTGTDIFYWSEGFHIYHGGQPRLDYQADGFDVVDFTDAGTVYINVNPYAAPHRIPDFDALVGASHSELFSIEGARWTGANDRLFLGEGVDLVEQPLLLDTLGDEGGRGDTLGFSNTGVALLFNAVSDQFISVQTLANTGEDAGYYATGVEWLEGSRGNDKIFVNSSIIGVEAGNGDDLIDARLVTAFSRKSPDGYDIEIYGGAGNDTIVSGAGETYANGGAGADTFVISSLTTTDNRVIFTIEGADSNDKLYVPFDFFNTNPGGYEGSQLFQVSGAPFKLDDVTTQSNFFADVPARQGPQSNFPFTGDFQFYLNGSDLYIEISQGSFVTETIDHGPLDPPETITYRVFEPSTAALVIVKNWSEGDLGINFPLTFTGSVFDDNEGDYDRYPGLLSAIASQTSASRFRGPVETRPDAHLPDEIASLISNPAAARGARPSAINGTEGNDVISSLGFSKSQNIQGFEGDDVLTGGNAGDTLNGGSGADRLVGGSGNDTYYVDNASDVIVESFKQGFDRVVSSIDYTLGANVEHLQLIGSAVNGTGNELRNTIEGNELDNTLSGGAGNDTLIGDLGNDTLIGGDGADGYVYALGDGRDIIIEASDNSNAADVLVLAGGISSGDLAFIRDPDALNDLIIRFPDGGGVTIRDYYLGNGAGLESIRFDDGTTWGADVLAQHATLARVTNNEAPIAQDDYYSAIAGAQITIPLEALIANDSDPEGDTLALISISNVTGGQAVIDSAGNVLVTPDTRSQRNDFSFEYTIGDGRGGTAKATAYFTIFGNGAPAISSAAFSEVREDAPATGRIIASDPDGDPLTFSVAINGAPSKGVLVVKPDGSFTYTPNANANGAEHFVVSVTDGFSAPVERVFDFTIAPVNDAPAVSGPITAAVTEDAQRIILNALQNASDADEGTVLRVVLPSSLPAGVTFDAATTSFVIDPRDAAFQHLKAGATQSISIDYAVSDGFASTPTSLIATITGVNDAAVIGGQVTGAVTEDQILSASGALSISDLDDGEAVFQARTLAGAYGQLSISASGAWTYNLNNASSAVQALRANQTLTDTISVTSLDGTARPLTITITGTNDAAVITGTLTGAVTEDTTLSATGTLSIADADNGEASFQASTYAAAYGSLVLSASGAWTYNLNNASSAVQALNSGQSLTDTIAIRSFDGTTKAIALTINGLNEAPSGIFGNDAANTLIGTSAGETIDARGGADTVRAGAGNDVIIGGAGNDILFGDDGDDTFIATLNDGADILNGGAGSDTYDLSAITSAVSIGLGLTFTNSSQTGIDLLLSIENVIGGTGNDTITGSDAANILRGGAGADIIGGQGGADRIAGEAGNDVLSGGAGSDTFVFAQGFGRDVITDFTAAGASHDIVEFQTSQFANWIALQAAITDSAAGAVITATANDTITFTGVTRAQLIANHVDDFRFL